MGFQLNSLQTLYFGGLGRIDYLEGEQSSFIAYFSKNLKIHRTKTIKADDLYNRHQTLQYEIAGIDSIAQMKSYEFRLMPGKTDIVISGLGFIIVSSKGGKVRVLVPPQISFILREAII